MGAPLVWVRYPATASIAGRGDVAVRRRTRLYAAALKVTTQSTRAPPRCRSFRNPPTVFIHPKTCSISFRFC
jgi:hypothetical protein